MACDLRSFDHHSADFLREVPHQRRNGFGIPRDDDLRNSIFTDDLNQVLGNFLSMLRLSVFRATLISRLRPSADFNAVHGLVLDLVVIELPAEAEHKDSRPVRIREYRGVQAPPEGLESSD